MNYKKSNDNDILFDRNLKCLTGGIKEIHNRTHIFDSKEERISELYVLSLHAFNSKFITDILSPEFVETEINNKFLRIVIYDSGKAEEDDEKNSEAILVLVKELLLKLNFTDGLAYDLLKAWKDYEEIVFDIKRFYREHFIHQFHDFLFGCLFLPQLWQSSSTFFNKRRFLRRWLLTALYHDIGYPAESLSEMHDNLHKRFFNKIPNYLISQIGMDTYDKNDENLPKLLKNIALIHLFSENISISDLPLTKIEHYLLPHTEIYNLLCDELRQSIDHGVTGAIFLLKTALVDLREVVVDPSSSHKTTISTEYEPYAHLVDDLFVAAAAIAGHNLRTKIYPSYTVDFSNRPIASLLNFCDDVQEWDRREKKDGKKLLWTKGAFKLKKVNEVGRKLFIEFTITEHFKTSSLDWLCDSLKQLFEANLSDINNTFYERIYLEIDKENCCNGQNSESGNTKNDRKEIIRKDVQREQIDGIVAFEAMVETIEEAKEEAKEKTKEKTKSLIIIDLNIDVDGPKAYRIGRYSYCRFDFDPLYFDFIEQILNKYGNQSSSTFKFEVFFFFDFEYYDCQIKAIEIFKSDSKNLEIGITPINTGDKEGGFQDLKNKFSKKPCNDLIERVNGIIELNEIDKKMPDQFKKQYGVIDMPVFCVSYSGNRMFAKNINIEGLINYIEYLKEKEIWQDPNGKTEKQYNNNV